MNVILAGIQGLAGIDDSGKIKILLAKLRFGHGSNLLLENDIIIDFTSWNHNSTTIEKIKTIRAAIAGHKLLEMEYYSGRGYCLRSVEPYKLIFKQENWYLFGYCKYREDFRMFKVNRITGLNISEEAFDLREDDTIPPLQSDFSNDRGVSVISFQTERPEWVISTFAGFGSRAEIISPDNLREEMKLFLKQAQKQYET